MARQITLDSQEIIEIKNSDGEVTGILRWNPTDLDIVKRCEKVMGFFGNMEVKNDTSAIEIAAEEIKKQFDFMLGANASEELFKHCNPLSPRENGEFYCEYVLNVLVRFIESEFDVRLKRTSSRIKKYTDKYKR